LERIFLNYAELYMNSDFNYDDVEPFVSSEVKALDEYAEFMMAVQGSEDNEEDAVDEQVLPQSRSANIEERMERLSTFFMHIC
jgi:hypothetical protein